MVEKKYIDTKGAAEYLNMSERYVQRLARKGEIPSYRPSGKMLLFNIEELDKWIVSSKANPTNTSMNKPILGIKCHKCGRVYFGHALAYILMKIAAARLWKRPKGVMISLCQMVV